MMTCDRCGQDTCVIFITSKHEKWCDECWDKDRKKKLPKYPQKE